MECSNDELCASVVAHELVLDAVRRVVEKGQLSSSDEEHVMLCLHPTSIEANEMEYLCKNVEDKLNIVVAPPDKREIPALRSLVEKELNQTFGLVDSLDAASGLTKKENQLTEHDITVRVTKIKEASVSLVPELDKLYKRGRITSQLIKESLDPVVNSASGLKSELLQNISEISRLESSILDEKFRDVSNDVLDRLVNDLEAEVAARGLENADEEPEMDEDMIEAILKLKEIEEELELKRACLEAVCPRLL